MKSASASQHFKNAQLISAVLLIKHLRNWIVCTCLSKRMNVNVSINYSIFSLVLSLRLVLFAFFFVRFKLTASTNESEGTLNPIIDSSTEIGSSFQFWFCPFLSLCLLLRSNYGVSSLILRLTLVIKVSNESISECSFFHNRKLLYFFFARRQNR